MEEIHMKSTEEACYFDINGLLISQPWKTTDIHSTALVTVILGWSGDIIALPTVKRGH